MKENLRIKKISYTFASVNSSIIILWKIVLLTLRRLFLLKANRN